MNLSTEYRVVNAEQVDPEALYTLYCSNRHYFEHFSLEMSREQLEEDMTILPEGCDKDQKHFLVYLKEEVPVALLDLIEGYPDEGTCYIGLFMVDVAFAGQGIGTRIITELCESLSKRRYKKIRLAYGKNYPQAEHFWTKNGFVPVKEAALEKYGALIVAQRELNRSEPTPTA